MNPEEQQTDALKELGAGVGPCKADSALAELSGLASLKFVRFLLSRVTLLFYYNDLFF